MARRRTSRRSRGRFPARPGFRVAALSRNGSAGARLTSTLTPAIVTVCLLGAFVAVTGPGRAIATAVLRFLLYYGGVFALIALTASVGIGLIATDRIVMKPGHRITAQAVHRAVSLAAVAFLIIHIWLEIAAARSHLADAVVPFLARERTFYIGLGTIASDLILLIAASGFLRAWFAGFSRPWAWRVVHASSYLAWLFSIIHGLLGGRHAKPYVDWSYGACVAAVALALTVRLVAARRSHEEVALSAAGPPPVPGGWQSLPPALAQASVTHLPLSLPAGRALPAGSLPGPAGPATGSYPAAPAATLSDLAAAAGTGPRTEPVPPPKLSGRGTLGAAPVPGTDRWPPAGPRTGNVRPPVPSPAGGFPPAASPAGGPSPLGRHGTGPARLGGFPSVSPPLGGPAPAPVRWDLPHPGPAAAGPGPSAWDAVAPAGPPWDRLRTERSPWDDLGPDPSPWEDLRPQPSGWGNPHQQPSPWDRLRPEELPPGPAAPPDNPLPRRVPGAAHTYRGRPGDR